MFIPHSDAFNDCLFVMMYTQRYAALQACQHYFRDHRILFKEVFPNAFDRFYNWVLQLFISPDRSEEILF